MELSVHLSNPTSEPLSRGELRIKLIVTGEKGSVRSSKRTKMADVSGDLYSWLLPSLCLILLADLILKYW